MKRAIDAPPSHALARLLLTREAGDAADSIRLADAVHDILEKLCARVATFVGRSGCAALLDRSLKQGGSSLGLPRPGSSQLRTSGQLPDSEEQLRELRQSVVALPPAAALEAVVTLLGTFIAILNTFIGEPLTSQILHGLWPDALPGKMTPT